MNALKAAISGFGAGAATMYFSDSHRRRYTRVLVRDQSLRLWNSFLRLLPNMDEDLIQLESPIELGNTHADGVG
jgi:hypothetical protein